MAAIFFLYGNKNVPSAEILRGRRCLRTRTFILFGFIFLELLIMFLYKLLTLTVLHVFVVIFYVQIYCTIFFIM
jgi:hypothetical protein